MADAWRSTSDIEIEIESEGQSMQEPAHFQGDFFGLDYHESDFDWPQDDAIMEHHDGSEGQPSDDTINSSHSHSPSPSSSSSSASLSPSPSLSHSPPPSCTLSPSPNPQHQQNIFIEKFTKGQVGATLNHQEAPKNERYSTKIDNPNNPYAPFSSKTDWELACWAKLRGPSSTAVSDLLDIEGVCIYMYIYILLAHPFFSARLKAPLDSPTRIHEN